MLFLGSIENLKNLNIIHFRKKSLVLSIICSKCENKDENVFNEVKSTETVKFLV